MNRTDSLRVIVQGVYLEVTDHSDGEPIDPQHLEVLDKAVTEIQLLIEEELKKRDRV